MRTPAGPEGRFYADPAVRSRRLRRVAEVTVIEMPASPSREMVGLVRAAWARGRAAGIAVIAPDVRVYTVPARLGGVR